MFDFDFGSTMNMTTALGRNLFPENIAREVFPRFNLPPLHSLMETLVLEMALEEVKRKNKEYNGRGEGILQQTRKFINMLSYFKHCNFRSKEHENTMVYTNSVTFIDRTDCFGFILKKSI